MKLICIILITILSATLTQADDTLDRVCKGPLFNFKLGQCDDDKVNRVSYELFTQPGQGSYTLWPSQENLRQSPFVPGNRVKVLIHGYGHGGPDKAFPWNVKNAYLQNQAEGTNVIVVNWSEAAKKSAAPRAYAKAASCTKNVADKTAYLLNFLVQEGATSLDKIHIIGHSLGAQIAGMTARHFNGNVARISGLDPARPCFRQSDPAGPHRLQLGDAKYLDILHTDGDTEKKLGQGLAEQMGHVDFYPNGGLGSQPGCKKNAIGLDDCSHNRAYELFAESVVNNGAFVGRICEQFDQFRSGACNAREVAWMGESAPVGKSSAIPFFLYTRDQSPFGLGGRGAMGHGPLEY